MNMKWQAEKTTAQNLGLIKELFMCMRNVCNAFVAFDLNPDHRCLICNKHNVVVCVLCESKICYTFMLIVTPNGLRSNVGDPCSLCRLLTIKIITNTTRSNSIMAVNTPIITST